jgi:hypothetical protein
LSVVTTGGVIFIIKSAFLSPNEAESSSINKPSLKATLVKFVEEIMRPRIQTQTRKKASCKKLEQFLFSSSIYVNDALKHMFMFLEGTASIVFC